MTIIAPSPSDCAPEILAALSSGNVAELVGGDYFLSSAALPAKAFNGPVPSWVVQGPARDACRIHALTDTPSMIGSQDLGPAPRGISLSGFTLDTAGRNIPTPINLSGRAPDATVALTFPKFSDLMILGGSVSAIALANAMGSELVGIAEEGAASLIQLQDCGQTTIDRWQAIGGSDFAIKVMGTFGSHFAEGCTIGKGFANGQAKGVMISNWSDFKMVDGSDISSCSGLALYLTGYFTDVKIAGCDLNSMSQCVQIDDNSRLGPAGNDFEMSGCTVYGIGAAAYGLAGNGQRIRIVDCEFEGFSNVDIFVQNMQDYLISETQCRSPNTNAPGQCSIWESAGMGAKGGKIVNCQTRGDIHLENALTIANSGGNTRLVG